MGEEYNIGLLAEKIETIKQAALELRNISGGIQAVDRHVDRILASVKMMEMAVTDVADVIMEV